MRRWKGLAPLIAVAVMGLLILLFAGTLSRWFASSRSAHNGAIVGHIVLAEGSVRLIHGPEIDLLGSPIATPIEFRDGDRLQTSVDSRAVVVLNSQDEIEIPAGAAVQFQLWSPADANSPIYVTVMLGHVDLKKPGVRGKAYVVKDGRLYLPGQKPLQKPMALTVWRSAPLDMHLADSGSTATEFTEDKSEPQVAANEPPMPTGMNNDPDTLSNEYIDQTIVNHQALLQKCWLSRLKETAKKGQIVVQFEIGKRGKVRDARVADSNLKDETLKSCVLSVFERLEFQPFKGADISLSYPINFE
jgi:TonB family protein